MSVFDDYYRDALASDTRDADHDDIHLFHDRKRFFAAVHRIKPQVTHDLIEHILPTYRPLGESFWAQSTEPHERWCPRDWFLCWAAIEHGDDSGLHGYQECRRLLKEWSQRWHLTDAWCLAAAVEKLANCIVNPHEVALPIYSNGGRITESPLCNDELPFVFEHPGWLPTLEGWPIARKQMEADFHAALDTYQQQIEFACRTRGFEPIPGPRKRKGDHCEWLARYQLGRDTYKEISDVAGVSPDAVERGVKEKAARIGLTLVRICREGRPRTPVR